MYCTYVEKSKEGLNVEECKSVYRVAILNSFNQLSIDKWQFCWKRERRRFRLLAITEPGK